MSGPKAHITVFSGGEQPPVDTNDKIENHLKVRRLPMRLFLTFTLVVFFISASAYTIAQTVPDTGAKLVQMPAFTLSDEAEAAGIEGRVYLAVDVDSMGAVKKAEVIAGPAWPCGSNPRKQLSTVRDGVRKNILAARFSPAVKNGKPTDTQVQVSVAVGKAYVEELKRQEEVKKAFDQSEKSPRIVEGGVINGRAISLPAPAYPYAARSMRAGGTVAVEITVSETGKVIKAGAVNGHRELQSAARNAACKAMFTPTVLEGATVRVNGIVTYNFLPPG